MPRPTRNSQATADDSLVGGETAVSSINARDVRSSSLLSSSETQPTASAVASVAQNSPGLVQSLVAAVEASVQTALPALVEIAVQQHSRANGNSSTSGLGEAANRFEMSGQPSVLSAPSPSSSRPLAMAARSSNQSISDPQGMLPMTSFVSAPGFLGTFNQEGSGTPAAQCFLATVSSLSAPISSVATLPTNSSALHPILEQPFVVGPGYSPIPYKVVATIVAGKYLNLADLLPDNNARPDDHEPQLFFNGRLALTAPRRVNKRQITDLVGWIEAFSIYTLILTSYFPHRWRDLTAYKLLIIRTYRQFAGRAWLNYDKAFREHVAAARVTDWSSLNVQLYNFHTAGSQVRAPGPRQFCDEPIGFSSSMIVCKSWNQGRCVAPSSQCRFKHACDRCNGDHRARECADISRPARLKSPEQSKRRKQY